MDIVYSSPIRCNNCIIVRVSISFIVKFRCHGAGFRNHLTIYCNIRHFEQPESKLNMQQMLALLYGSYSAASARDIIVGPWYKLAFALYTISSCER
jgi:hypothetical protein